MSANKPSPNSKRAAAKADLRRQQELTVTSPAIARRSLLRFLLFGQRTSNGCGT
jgi:hypothetical protein